MTGRTMLAAGVAIVVGAAVAAGLVLMGSPTEARNRRLDSRRVADLRQIARNVDVFWTRREQLPASLDELATGLGVSMSRLDPETGAAYAYRALGGPQYELCAVFATESGGEPPRAEDRFWVHGSGLVCFQLAAETAEREPGQAVETGRGRGR